MFFQFVRLQWLKTIRSASLGRKVISSIILALLGGVILLNILALGISLKRIVIQLTGRLDIAQVINEYLAFFFFFEMIYRFFLQKTSSIELEQYLHLPVGRSKIIHFLLFRSFISPFNLVVILLFTPVYWMTVRQAYGASALIWLLTIIGMSWCVHWFMLWFKQKLGDSITGILVLFGIFMLGVGSASYGWFNIGNWMAPFLNDSLQSFYPLLGVILCSAALYINVFHYYRRHAYIEELTERKKARIMGSNLVFFNRFGLAGAVADMELKLILRHKRSRMVLVLSVLFLAYGLILYPDMVTGSGIPTISVFVGLFITGIFIMNYGQLFLSWNSPHFDFFLDRNRGVESLVRGKHLLFFGISTLCFILSIPYVYFGWPILVVHTATFLFNIGINMHIIIYMALWKPKPIDLQKGAMFNYEGAGAAQFLMAIPMVGLPYLIYLPFAFWVSKAIGIVVLASLGIIGLIFHEKFVALHINKILKNKYAISSSFRQEL